MEFVPVALVIIAPTVLSFIYFLTRPHLGVWAVLTVFAIWFFSSIPLGAVVYGLSGLFYLGTVGHGAWDANPRAAEMAVATPVSLILNGYLTLLAWAFDSWRRRREKAAG